MFASSLMLYGVEVNQFVPRMKPELLGSLSSNKDYHFYIISQFLCYYMLNELFPECGERRLLQKMAMMARRKGQPVMADLNPARKWPSLRSRPAELAVARDTEGLPPLRPYVISSDQLHAPVFSLNPTLLCFDLLEQG